MSKADGCYNVFWDAHNAGSQIVAPVLSTLVGGNCGTFYLRAYSGSQLVLSNLVSISGGYVTGLNSFLSPNGQNSSLTAQNNGIILLGTQAFLLANVNVSIPPGNPVLPPSFIAGANMTLYGTPWHSYLIESRTTLIPDAGWQFSQRVPLTNTFQIVSGSPPANTAFRVSELIANPGLFDFFRTTNQTLLVFYSATNQTYQILTATNLTPPTTWTTSGVVTMSNTFRFLVPVSAAEPQRYFRARQP